MVTMNTGVADPRQGAKGPRMARTTGRNRNTIVNVASKYPNNPSGRAPSVPVPGGVARPSPVVASPVPVNTPRGISESLATLTQAMAATSTLGGLMNLQQQAAALTAPGPSRGGPPRDIADRAEGGRWEKPSEFGTPEQNIAMGRYLAEKKFGWVGEEWKALLELGGRESGWEETAKNPTSGAFGIPQALPSTKMNAKAQAGHVPSQIRWMLQYIKERYGSPSRALAFHNANGWY